MAILSGELLERLVDAITDSFSDTDLDLDVVRQVTNNRFIDFAGSNQGFKAQVLALIDAAESGGWLLEMIEQAQSERQSVTEFNTLLEEIHGSPLFVPGAHVIHDTHVVNLDQPILDRTTLREHLELLDSGSRKILVILGAQGSGKTHSKKLIYHLQKVRGFRITLIDFKRFVPDPESGLITPYMLGRQIDAEMGQPAPERPKHESLAFWNKDYVDGLKGRFDNDPTQYWIVVDHLDMAPTTSDMKDLIRRLAFCADETASVRLILLGYEDSDDFEPDDLEHPIVYDPIPAIGDEELLLFFMRFYEQVNAKYNAVHDITQEAINSAETVLSQVDLDSPRMLTRLKSETSKEVRRILGTHS